MVRQGEARECSKNSDMEECDAVRGEQKGIARGKHKHTHTIYCTYEAGLNKKISLQKKTGATEKYQKWVELDGSEARVG